MSENFLQFINVEVSVDGTYKFADDFLRRVIKQCLEDEFAYSQIFLFYEILRARLDELPVVILGHPCGYFWGTVLLGIQ